jgi:4-amino-4-deoxy-L-arabinose transferase-like glycosyltransferase
MAKPGGVHAVLLVLAVLLFVELPGSWLLDPDETRYAEIAREMVASGDYVTPHLNGAAWSQKPPLLYWLQSLSFHAFGTTDFAARLPARLAAVGAALVMLRETPVGAPPWAALLFLATPVCFILGRFDSTDGMLGFFLLLSSHLLRRCLAALEEGRKPPLLFAAFGAAVAGGFMTKGVIGIVFPGLTLLAWAAVLGRWKRVAQVILSPAPPVFLLLASPWFLLMERAHPGYFEWWVKVEHFQRYAGNKARHGAPIWYLPGVFLAALLPWTPFLPGAVRHLCTRSRETLRRHSDDLFVALWIAVVILFFSAGRSRLATYVVPAIPAAAILVARHLAAGGPASRAPYFLNAAIWTVLAPIAFVVSARRGASEGLEVAPLLGWAMASAVAGSWLAVFMRGRTATGASSRAATAPAWIAGGMAGLYLVAIFALPDVARRRSLHDVAVAASRETGAEVVAYDDFEYSLPWTLGRPVAVAAHTAEMGTDDVFPPEIFWSEKEFWERWGSGRRIVAIHRFKEGSKFRAEGRPKARVIVEPRKEWNGYGVIANFER